MKKFNNISYKLVAHAPRVLLFTLFLFILASCEKIITVDLPPTKDKIVVDGRIEAGIAPYIILTHNMPYFGNTDLSSIQKIFIHDAVIKVSDGVHTATLTEYCSQSISDSLLPIVARFTGVSVDFLRGFNYCIYTTFDPSIFGVIGKRYNLTVESEGKTLTASTQILRPVRLDSLWPRYTRANQKGDSLGFIWAHLSDPQDEQNNYRWLAMRKRKDFSFVPPIGSVFDDKFVNGKSFDFAYNRGSLQNAPADGPDERSGYFRRGDTVIVKFCSIDRASYNYFFQMDQVIMNSGSPFANPSSVPTNVSPASEALGIWCSYGASLQTVIFK